MELLLCRHAQSANNALEESLRVPDPGLTEIGATQAEKLAQWVMTLQPSRLLCSAFRRSLDTTEPIRQRTSLEPEIVQDLHEQGGCYSGYRPGERAGEEGMSRAELQTRYPGYRIDDRIGHRGWWQSKSYESHAEAIERARRMSVWLAMEVKKTNGLTVAIIHADFKRLLLGEMLHAAVDVKRLGSILNTSATRLRLIDGEWHLDIFNSISHLPSHLITD